MMLVVTEIIECGLASGPTVLHLHSPGGFPFEITGLDPMAVEVGVRVLGVERESLPSAGRGPVAAIVDEAVAHLGERLPPTFGVLGWSGGAPFALATAARFPARVTRAVVVCPVPGWLRGAGAVGAVSPRLAAIAAGEVPPVMRSTMDVLANPWGFEVASVSAPIVVWYAGEDDVVPPALVEERFGDIRSADLRLFPDESHFLPMGRWDELLRLAGGSG